MDSQTKHDIWIMTVSMLATVVVATIAFVVFSQVHYAKRGPKHFLCGWQRSG